MNGRRWKWFLVAALAAALTIGTVCTAAGRNLPVSGNYMYSVDENGNATIVKYTFPPTGALTLPYEMNGFPVTAIGEGAFRNSTKLTSVVVPAGVTTIGSSAFEGCTALTDITLPVGVQTVGDRAFASCSALKEVVLPVGVTGVGASVFSDCTSLTGVRIPSGVVSIGYRAFYRCTSLTSVTLPASVKTISNCAFQGCRALETLVLPSGVTSIGDWAFYQCTALSGITIPSGVAKIGPKTFFACSSLKSVDLPSGLTGISESAFEGCSALTGVVIPGGVQTVSKYAFADCRSLSAVTLSSGVTEIDDDAFYRCSALKSADIPASVKRVGNYAFYECNALTEIGLAYGTAYIGESAFEGCTSLAAIDIPGSVWDIGSAAFMGCTALQRASLSEGVRHIGNYGFQNCRQLQCVSLPSSLTNIGTGAFYGCSALAEVSIPGSVQQVAINAFFNCTSLEKVTISSGVMAIRREAFSGCSALKSVAIPDSVTTIAELAFYGCKALTEVELPPRLTVLNTAVFSGCRALRSVRIPSGLIHIGDSAFYGCASLAEIDIPSSVTAIGASAFEGCSSLAQISVPSGVTSIGEWAFSRCTGLTHIELPSGGIKRMSNYLFSGCTSLTGVNVPSGVTIIGYGVFSGCSALQRVSLPAGLNSIYKGAFENCGSLTYVSLPDGTVRIGESAFAGCSALSRVDVPASVADISDSAFTGCGALTLGVDKESYAWEWATSHNVPFEMNLTAAVTCAETERQTGEVNRYTVVAEGGTAPYTYQYSLYRDGVLWSETEWLAEDSCDVSYLAPGVYVMQVTVQDQQGRLSKAVCSGETTVTASMSAGVTSKYTARAVGEANRYYATAEGGTAPYTYQYALYKDGALYSESAWLTEDNYRVDYTEPGVYVMRVTVQDQNGVLSDPVESGETVVIVPVTATAMGKYTDREVGQPNRYYATAEGGTAPYTYYFRLYKDGAVYHNSGWITEDNYRIDFTEAGTYTMTVKVQDANGNKTDWVECTKTVVKESAAVTAPTVKVSGKYTEREVGQPNRYYATAQGGTAPYTYYFRLYKDGIVYHNSGWITADNYRIDFTEAGTYTMTVKVQDAKGNKSDWVECTKTVVKASAAASTPTVKVSGKYTEREPGQPNRYYATALGGTAPYTYYFRLYKDGIVYHNSGWITVDNYRIDFTEAGTYTMTVKVQDAKGIKTDWVECTKTVVKASAAATTPTVKVSGKYTEREVGQPNRYYATAQGGTAPYTYYFRLYKDGVVYHNSGWIVDDNYRIDFTEAGTYTMTVKVQDAKGNKSDWVYCTKTVVK